MAAASVVAAAPLSPVHSDRGSRAAIATDVAGPSSSSYMTRSSSAAAGSSTSAAVASTSGMPAKRGRKTAQADQHAPAAVSAVSAPAAPNVLVLDEINAYFCVHCKKVDKAFGSIVDVYQHWAEAHRPLLDRFQFSVGKHIGCSGCRKLFNIIQLKRHLTGCHSNALYSKASTMQCGLCTFRAASDQMLAQHAADKHGDTQTCLPDRVQLSDQLIRRIAAETVVGLIPCRGVVFGCSDCDWTEDDELAMAVHMWGHKRMYQCCECDRRYNGQDLVKMLKEHHGIMHGQKKAAPRLVNVQRDEPTLFNGMKITMPNGLTYTKGGATQSGEYGGMMRIFEQIRRLQSKEIDSLFDRR